MPVLTYKSHKEARKYARTLEKDLGATDTVAVKGKQVIVRKRPVRHKDAGLFNFDIEL